MQLEDEKLLLAEIAPSFLTANEFAVITRALNLNGEGAMSRRDIAKELQMTTTEVMDYKRDALDSIKANFPSAQAEYERQHCIKQRNAPRRAFA
jgi:hypothetical protein